MFRAAALLLATLLAAVPGTVQAGRVELNGYSVVAPAERGWIRSAGGAYDIGFGAMLSRTHTWGLTAAVLPAPVRFESAEALLEHLNARMMADTDPQRFEVVDAQAWPEKWPGALCGRTLYKAYDRAAATRTAPYSILEVSLLTCVHPESPERMVEVGYHARYAPGEPSRIAEAGERFMGSLRFATPVPDAALNLRFAADLMAQPRHAAKAEPLIVEAIALYRAAGDLRGLAAAHRAHAGFLVEKAVAHAGAKELDAACELFERSVASAEDVVRAYPAARPYVPAGYSSFTQFVAENKKRYACP